MKNLLLILLAALWLTAGFAQSNDKIDPKLYEEAIQHDLVEAIIIFAQQADLAKAKDLQTKAQKGQFVFQQLTAIAEQEQKQVRQLLQTNAVNFHPFYIFNGIYAKADIALLETIAQRPEVARIQPDPLGQIQEARPQTTTGGRDLIEWGIEMIGANEVWALGFTGQGVIVGGQDTGVEWEHPAIKEKYRGWNGTTADHNYNWHDAISEISPLHGDTTDDESLNPCGLQVDIPCDDHNHGTHTVGTMVGDDGDANQIGVAPDAQWIAARNMERGWGKLSTYTDCFEWFLAPTDLNGQNPDPLQAPHVINNSWGCPPIEGCNIDNWSIMETAVNNLRAAGVVVVVSAGNDGANCGKVQNPASIFEGSFTVGASNNVDTLGGFSSAGPVMVDGSMRLKPNVVAPGVQVRSCVRNGGYATWNGTSMAGPHVAGVVALMISANPELAGQVELIEDIIEQTAVPLYWEEDCEDFSGSAHPNTYYGYGRIDALAAVQMAMTATATEEQAIAPATVVIVPNPASERINIEFGNLSGTAQLRILNVSGQLMHSETINLDNLPLATVNVSDWNAGLYYYTIETPNNRAMGKFVKQ